jgi:Chaperone of endosialidase
MTTHGYNERHTLDILPFAVLKAAFHGRTLIMIIARQCLRVRTFGFLLAILLALVDRAAAQKNTAFGEGALVNNTGSSDSAFGFNALLSNTAGSNNTANGVGALATNTTSNNNTATGVRALHNTIGRGNTADGVSALFSASTGVRNTASGASALFSNTTGNNNIALGWEAGDNLTTGNHNIEIGSQGAATDGSTIRLGTQGTQTATFIAGVSDTAVTGADVVVSSDGQLGVLPSSVRYKRDIRPLDDRSQRLWQLRPVTFRYKQDPQGQRQYGLIAEEVAKIFPELVVRGSKGEIESVQYRELIPLMLSEMQHQQAAVATLKAENSRLEARLARLEENRTTASR